MRILAAGGGSGGHVTPVLAVLNELRRHDKTLEAWFICDRGFGRQAAAIMSQATFPVTTRAIYAGKLRRYHRMSLGEQLRDIPTVLRNLRDLFLVGVGFVQSLWLLLRFRPDAVFTKGGFVCLPVGLAAALLRIPLVIHDSDAHAGLTNRVLARYATTIATGAPLENYSYDPKRSHYVGIPVAIGLEPVTEARRRELKGELGLPDTKKPLIVVTGGGLGARRINDAMVAIAKELLPHTAIIHITGTRLYDEVVRRAPGHANYVIKPFIDKEMTAVLAAADIVVARAGATTMAELVALAKPVVIIPNPILTGGHQLKNAAVYEKAGAAIVLDEQELQAQPDVLLKTLLELLGDPEEREQLGKELHTFAKPDAAIDTARLLVEAAKAGQGTAMGEKHVSS